MTQEQTGGVVLEFGIADRLRKAREHIGAGPSAFAELTGISRGTISNYEDDAYRTRKTYILAQWAMATGVSPEWLVTGAGSASGPGGPDGALPATPGTALEQRAAQKRARHAEPGATPRYQAAA